MGKKKAAARKQTWAAMPPVTQCGRWMETPTSTREEEQQLAQAILESKACSMQTDTYKASLATALNFSKFVAEEEAAEAEAFRLAMAASLAEAEEKSLGLGLKMSASSRPEAAAEKLGWRQHRLAPFPSSCASGIAEAVHAIDAPSSEVTYIAEAVANHTTVVAESAAEAMPVSDATLIGVLKVTYGQDVRRLRTQWPSDARPLDILASIRSTIEESFGLPSGSAFPPEYFLKYSDDEGDLCTLLEDTVADFLDVMGWSSQGITLKVILEKRLQSKEPGILEDFTCVPSMQSNGPESLVDHACAEEGIHNTESESLQEHEGLEGFSISTPPVSPRCSSSVLCSGTFEDDYESMWSLVEAKDGNCWQSCGPPTFGKNV